MGGVNFGRRLPPIGGQFSTPLNIVFNQFGDLERCALRPGNVHCAHRWRDVLVPVVGRYKE